VEKALRSVYYCDITFQVGWW